MPAQTQIMYRQLCKQTMAGWQRQRQPGLGPGLHRIHRKWVLSTHVYICGIRTMAKGIANVAEGTQKDELSMGVCDMA